MVWHGAVYARIHAPNGGAEDPIQEIYESLCTYADFGICHWKDRLLSFRLLLRKISAGAGGPIPQPDRGYNHRLNGHSSTALDGAPQAKRAALPLAYGALRRGKIYRGLVPVCAETLEVVYAADERVVAALRRDWCYLAGVEQNFKARCREKQQEKIIIPRNLGKSPRVRGLYIRCI